MDPLPPSVQLMQFITGHWIAAAVHAAARFHLADHMSLRDSSVVVELAKELGLHEASLYRLLRALASLGLFEEDEQGFRLTAFGAHLRADHADSVKAMALFQGSTAHWQGWSGFAGAVKSGRSAFEAVHGEAFFKYLESDSEYSAHFDAAMTVLSRRGAPFIAEGYDFSAFGSLCDVGGGQALLLAEILVRNPDLRGILFDLPHVAKGARAVLKEKGVEDRCEVVVGDFFGSLPKAGAYIARHIIHDWDDERAVKILSNMLEGLEEGGKLLVVESVIAAGNDPDMAKFLDLEMLHATSGGRERRAVEFEQLFAMAGACLEDIHRLPNGECILVAVPKA